MKKTTEPRHFTPLRGWEFWGVGCDPSDVVTISMSIQSFSIGQGYEKEKTHL